MLKISNSQITVMEILPRCNEQCAWWWTNIFGCQSICRYSIINVQSRLWTKLDMRDAKISNLSVPSLGSMWCYLPWVVAPMQMQVNHTFKVYRLRCFALAQFPYTVPQFRQCMHMEPQQTREWSGGPWQLLRVIPFIGMVSIYILANNLQIGWKVHE